MTKEELFINWLAGFFNNAKPFDKLTSSLLLERVNILTTEARASVEAEKCDIVCPFCGDSDFDHIGLKIHLTYCEKYANTPYSDPTPYQPEGREG